MGEFSKYIQTNIYIYNTHIQYINIYKKIMHVLTINTVIHPCTDFITIFFFVHFPLE